jgi:hypothetical protein
MTHRKAVTTIVKAAPGLGQRRHVAFPLGDVAEALFGGEGACPIEHRRGHVDAGRVPEIGRKRVDDDAAAASNVEQRVVGAGRRGGDESGIRCDPSGGRSRRPGSRPDPRRQKRAGGLRVTMRGARTFRQHPLAHNMMGVVRIYWGQVGSRHCGRNAGFAAARNR